MITVLEVKGGTVTFMQEFGDAKMAQAAFCDRIRMSGCTIPPEEFIEGGIYHNGTAHDINIEMYSSADSFGG